MNKAATLSSVVAVLTTLAFTPVIAAGNPADNAAGCDRTCLKGFMDKYFAALAKNNPTGLPLAANAKFTENGATLKLGEGFWKTAGEAAYRLDIFDPESGGAAAHSTVREKDELVMFMLRLKVAAQKITEIETIVARKGVSSGEIWAPQTLKQPSPNFTLSIRPAEQNSRLELMGAADAYWRAFETNGTPDYHPAPFLPDANRFENGLQTTNRKLKDWGPYTAAEQFDRGLFQGRSIYDRRYPVIDAERGVALSIVRFGYKEGVKLPNMSTADAAPLVAEFFCVHAGRIQEIQVVMTTMPKAAPTGW